MNHSEENKIICKCIMCGYELNATQENLCRTCTEDVPTAALEFMENKIKLIDEQKAEIKRLNGIMQTLENGFVDYFNNEQGQADDIPTEQATKNMIGNALYNWQNPNIPVINECEASETSA